MSSKKKKKLGKLPQALLFTALVYSASTAVLPISLAVRKSMHDLPETSQVVKDLELEETIDKINLPKYYGIIDVLKVAHFLVAAKLEPVKQEPSISFYPDIGISLYWQQGTCNEYAFFVHAVYQELAKRVDRPGFKESVKIAGDFIEDKQGFGAHSWIIVKDGSRWKNYETLEDWFDPEDIEQMDFQGKIREIIPDKEVLDVKGKEYHHTTESIMTGGGMYFVPTVTSILTAPYKVPIILWGKD